jgi:hypothetical protein
MDQPRSFVPVPLPKTAKGALRPYELQGGASLAQGRTFQIPAWKNWGMARRLAFLRTLIEGDSEDSGWMKDPQVKELARWIVGQSNVNVYEHPEKAWGVLLAWVQQNIPYINEPGEQFQSPQYTLECAQRKMGGGDCDDLMILLASLGGSLGLPWRMVLYGYNTSTKAKVRYIESPKSSGEGVAFLLWNGDKAVRTTQMHIGGPVPAGVKWQHIYLACGLGSLSAGAYTPAEPTLSVPLGWDALDQKYTGGRPDLSGTASLAGPLGDAPEPATAPSGLLASTWSDIKANVHIGQVVAAALPSLLVLMLAPHLTRKRRNR